MSSTTTISFSADRNFYERTLLGFFAGMTRGYMHLTMPDGEVLTFGTGEGDIVATINVHDAEFFKRCILYGDIGFGEAYEEGIWDTENITTLLKWFLLNIDNAPSVSGSKVRSLVLNTLKFFNKLKHINNTNTISGSKKNIAAHYDLDNNFFSLFLDSTMTYSSAYFYKEGLSLQQAQEAKYERLCRQLKLQPTDHVLEIGSGWGGNAIYMASKYGCEVTTITISQEQYDFAQQRIKEAGLDHRITILIQDYRTMQGSFDKIVSIEMIEAVGHKFLKSYFGQCCHLLKRNGIFALQAITCPDSRYNELKNGVDWIQKHIFPGSLLPSVAAMNKAVNETGDLTLVDVKDIGLDYATTLHLWKQQFNTNVSHIRALGFTDSFIRKWNYYFSYCEAAFAMRNINVLQLVYTRPNNTSR